MKIIGPKSISTGLSYLFLTLFIILTVKSIYMFFTFGVGYYNWTYSQNFLSELVEVAKTPQLVPYEFEVYFRFKYPFSNIQMMMGFFTLRTFVFHTFQHLFFCLFFFFTYKVFKELSQQNIFTTKIIKLLSIFSVINILYAPLLYFIWSYIFNANIDLSLLMTCFAFLFLGVIIFFIIAFFKKGYELQSDNDLTI